MRPRVFVQDVAVACALGCGKAEVAEALFAGCAPGLRSVEGWSPGGPLTLGVLDAELPAVPFAEPRWHSRNNRILLLAWEQIRAVVEAQLAGVDPVRIGIVLGTSTSGIAEAEPAVAQFARDGSLPPAFHYGQQEIGAPARFLARVVGARGPAYTVSTACTSSAKALASAQRLLDAGICDYVIAGGADSLCGLTVNGFGALGAVSAVRCNPFSRNRCGINIGEGAALFALSRQEAEVALLGTGESSDAYHISAPDPAGHGARLAIEGALRSAGLRSADVDYLNLHGTATQQNDAMESVVVNALFGERLACSSTKPLTGHTLGAAGAVEAALCWLAVSPYNRAGKLPPHLWDGEPDPALPPLGFCGVGQTQPRLRVALSSSFAFGGSNACVALGRT